MGDTYSTNLGPICPYCKHENASQGNDYWAEERGEGVVECDQCEREFAFIVDFTTHYYGKPIQPDEAPS